MKSTRFIKIDPALLRRVAAGNIKTPSLYYHPNWILRNAFWQRLVAINGLMRLLPQRATRCLDFGGGSGIFLPTLTNRFDKVTCIDLDTREAHKIVAALHLSNVEIVQSDIGAVDYSSSPFDAIVAADVLEHFADLAPALSAIRSWLAPGGLLFTSLPTENWVYTSLRAIFRVEAPEDHYHNGAEVENELKRAGFERVEGTYLPLPVRIAPLFLISAWRYGGDQRSS